MHRNRSMTAFAASLMLAGGVCMAQAQQPAVRDTLPEAQGAAADKSGASDRATASDRAQPAAAQQAGQAHADMAGMQGGKQVDQQIQQQLQKIGQTKEMAADKLFVLHAGLGNQYEMALAQQAQQKAQNPQVKQLAQRILQDHQQASQQLMQVAQKLQVELPQGLPSMKQQELQVIGSLESQMFDQKFVCKMDELHAHDVAAFRNASQIAQSPDVKQFASQTLPKLQQHHQLVQQTGSAVGLNTDAALPAGSRIEGTSPRSGASDAGTSGSTSPRSTGSGNQPGLDDPQRSGSNPKIPGQGTTTPPNRE